MKRVDRIAIVVASSVLLGCVALAVSAEEAGERRQIATVLDDFHAAASEADGDRYFSHFAPGGIFLGTDGSERWTLEEFRAFAEPYFSQGKGWTYLARDRHITLGADQRTAWFDEALDNDSYGECRGSGVLQKQGEAWKIEQYNLSIPMPNSLAKDFVAQIREHASTESEAQN